MTSSAPKTIEQVGASILAYINRVEALIAQGTHEGKAHSIAASENPDGHDAWVRADCPWAAE